MKNLYATLFLLSFGLIANLSAQTLKNIHRHNQPVQRIPTELIDKIQVVQLDTNQVLQIVPFVGEVIQVPLSEIDSITHYTGSIDPSLLGTMRTTSVMGVVRNANNEPINNAIVRSPFGGEETRTDLNGVFFLNNIIVYDKLGYVTIEKTGFHKGSRSFLPLTAGTTNINVQLLPMVSSGMIFSPINGGQITSGPLQLNFPPNAFLLNGQPFIGVVRVYASTLDPTSAEMSLQMPGDMIGGLNDSLRLLRSFGMAAVELRDLNMNPVQLAPGIEVTVTYTIPDALQAQAPNTIDLWSFDDLLGYWKHEGQAQKQGNQYVATATHFSWWNLDVPGTFNELQGTILNASNAPIPNAMVSLTSPTLGSISVFANTEGEFSGRVPTNQVLNANVYLVCPTTNQLTEVLSESINSVVDSISVSFTASLSGFYPLTGPVVNCQGQPISQGYVSLGSQVFLTNQGEFTIQTCSTGDFTIQGFDISTPDSTLVSEPLIVQVGSSGANAGNIQACSQYASTVTDIDGNVYQTLLIGTQLWMQENLRTSQFSTGSVIPNEMGDCTVWTQLTTPAWSHYNNDPANEAIYGKLYNGWTATNSQNVCPTGWHVPNLSEYTVLLNYLGGANVAGGKMKAINGWNIPNSGATNSSGFSALPGGVKCFSGSSDGFGDLGTNMFMWSSQAQSGSNNGAYISLSYVSEQATIFSVSRKVAMSIRCVKD